MNDALEIDPQMLPILQGMRERIAARPAAWEIDMPAMRARMCQDLEFWNAEPLPLARVENREIAGAFGPVTIRRYDPVVASGPQPALVYFHGGGWVAGDLDTEDRALRLLARESGVAVLSVDYALAPEHRFPGPLHDCETVWRTLCESASDWRLDPQRLALGGASAGANLALACAVALRDGGRELPRLLLLQYGVYSGDHDTPSSRRYGDGRFGLSVAQMDFFWSMYLERPEQRIDPRAAPLHAELAGLPEVFMTAAGLDPLLDDSLRLDERLTAAGVPHRLIVYPGVVHGFTLMNRSLDAAVTAARDAAAVLRRILT